MHVGTECHCSSLSFIHHMHWILFSMIMIMTQKIEFDLEHDHDQQRDDIDIADR